MTWKTLFDTGMFVMSRLSIHHEAPISMEAHPQPDTPKGDQSAHPHTPAPVSIKSGLDFPAHRTSGQPGGKGGWQADNLLKGSVNDSPEARSSRLQKVKEHHRDARQAYHLAHRQVSDNKPIVIASEKKVSDLKIQIGQTQRSVENKTRIVEHYASSYTRAENNLTGASNKLDERSNQFKQQPQNEATRSKLATAQERYHQALHHRDSTRSALSSARSALAQEQKKLSLQRQDLADAEHELSLNETKQTEAENDLAKAKVEFSQVKQELKMDQA
jgi:chromosome segregation ATPase